MDRVTKHPSKASAAMPPRAPLVMKEQDLSAPFTDPAAPVQPARLPWLERVTVFVPAFATTILLIVILLDWFQADGFNWLEYTMLALAGFSAFWIALSVSTATLGMVGEADAKTIEPAAAIDALDVALMVPVYNEDPAAVFARIRTMRNDLAFTKTNHRFAFFVLSDTRDEAIAAQEQRQFEALRDASRIPLFYRRRAQNIERKTGNIRDLIENWGSAWDAFITLDADSLMGARTIMGLADRMAGDRSLGLLQTVPHLMGAQTLFARCQQFANNTHGDLLAEGLDRISGKDGNYWGHNAIIRTRAFAACAGLPRLRERGPLLRSLAGTIKSHDFVEAALLLRAGWTVRIWPPQENGEARESFEEVPQNLVDYTLRDRRWCQGNLQHLRLLTTPGFTAMSRFHLFQGAMAYMASVVWFALLLVWTLMGRNAEQNVLRYFTDTNPLFPQWPQMDAVSRAVVLGFMIALLLTPKLFSICRHVWRDPACTAYGGPLRFFSHCLLEIALSVALAPLMMVQHVLAVLRTFMGFDAGWSPQNRAGTSYSWIALLRFHLFETVLGLALVSGMVAGIVTPWLAPIAASLALAVPLSWLTGQYLSGWAEHVLQTKEAESPLIEAATLNRHWPT
ncbi:MAG: glucans biosynthesis glucosyltransferase MdoH [Pseudomonadota bacterium]